jgi:hypothetical protein
MFTLMSATNPICRLLLAPVFSGALLLSLTGCGDESGGKDGSGDNAEVIDGSGVVLPPCIDSTDCLGGQLCRAGVCREACAENDACRGPLRACDTAAGICEECISDEDCGVAEQCSNRSCEFFCRADEDCAQPLYCEFSDGTCFAAECLADTDCSGGFRCADLRCVPIGGPDVECVSDENCRGGFRCDDGSCVQILP